MAVLTTAARKKLPTKVFGLSMIRPERGSFDWRIYNDLVIGKKLFVKKRTLFSRVAKERNVPRRQVVRIYDRYIRVSLRNHTVKELY